MERERERVVGKASRGVALPSAKIAAIFFSVSPTTL